MKTLDTTTETETYTDEQRENAVYWAEIVINGKSEHEILEKVQGILEDYERYDNITDLLIGADIYKDAMLKVCFEDDYDQLKGFLDLLDMENGGSIQEMIQDHCMSEDDRNAEVWMRYNDKEDYARECNYDLTQALENANADGCFNWEEYADECLLSGTDYYEGKKLYVYQG